MKNAANASEASLMSSFVKFPAMSSGSNDNYTLYQMAVSYKRSNLDYPSAKENPETVVRAALPAEPELSIESAQVRDFFNDFGDADQGLMNALPITMVTSDSRVKEIYAKAYKSCAKTHWSKANLEKLYNLLEVFGADPFTIQSQFPEFTEKQIRSRINMERKRSPQKFYKACTTKSAGPAKSTVATFKTSKHAEFTAHL